MFLMILIMIKIMMISINIRITIFDDNSDYNRVVATDGRQNDTTRVNITVININDWDPR